MYSALPSSAWPKGMIHVQGQMLHSTGSPARLQNNSTLTANCPGVGPMARLMEDSAQNIPALLNGSVVPAKGGSPAGGVRAVQVDATLASRKQQVSARDMDAVRARLSAEESARCADETINQFLRATVSHVDQVRLQSQPLAPHLAQQARTSPACVASGSHYHAGCLQAGRHCHHACNARAEVLRHGSLAGAGLHWLDRGSGALYPQLTEAVTSCRHARARLSDCSPTASCPSLSSSLDLYHQT